MSAEDGFECFAFLDCNVVLHYQSLDQLPWDEILGTTHGAVVVSVSLLDEIDKKTYDGSSSVKERARARRTWLVKRLREKNFSLRGGAQLVFEANLHGLDLRTEGLDPNRSDDQMIAEVFSSQRKRSRKRHSLVTSDATLQVRATSRSIETIELDPKFLQPIEDQAEKEIRRLREELQRQKNRMPDLSIDFGDAGKNLVVTLDQPAPRPGDEIEDALKKARAENPALNYDDTKAPERLGDPFGLVPGISFEQVDTYNGRLKTYFAALEKGLRDGFFDGALVVELPIVLHNNGTAPAERIGVNLRFPPGVFMTERRVDVSNEPQPPKLPRPVSKLIAFLESSQPPLVEVPALPNFGPNRGPEIEPRAEGDEVSYFFDRLDHHYGRRLTLFANFDNRASAISFRIAYSVTSASLADELKGSLNVQIVKPAAPERTDGS